MSFEIDNLIILTEDGKDSFGIPSNKLGPIYKVTSAHKNTINVFAYELSDQKKFKNLISTIYYRIATESEVRTYKLKNIFRERSHRYGN